MKRTRHLVPDDFGLQLKKYGYRKNFYVEVVTETPLTVDFSVIFILPEDIKNFVIDLSRHKEGSLIPKVLRVANGQALSTFNQETLEAFYDKESRI